MEPIAVNHAERAEQVRRRRLEADAERAARASQLWRQLIWAFFFIVDLKAMPVMAGLLMTSDPVTSPRQFLYRYLAYAIGIFSFVVAMRMNSRALWRVFFQNYLILGFFVLEVMFSFLAVSPKDALTQLFIYGTSVLLVSSAKSIFNSKQFLEIVILVSVFTIFGSVFTSVFMKGLGLNEKGVWVGMFVEKNAFGHASAMATGIIFIAGPKYMRNPIFWAVTLITGILCVAESKCGSGLIMLACMIVGSMFLRIKSAPLRISGLCFLAAGGILFSAYSSDIIHTLLTSLGKDETLSGRTKVWGFAAPLIAEHWLTGAGYDWTSYPDTVQYLLASIGLPHLHNAYITAIINSGALCAALFFFSYLRAGLSALTMRVPPSAETARLIYWAILIGWFLSGFTEPIILNSLGALTIFGLSAVYGLLSLERESAPVPLRRQSSRVQPA